MINLETLCNFTYHIVDIKPRIEDLKNEVRKLYIPHSWYKTPK